MSMRISTLTQNLRSQSTVTNLQSQLSIASQQVATGKVSQVFSGYRGEDARTLVDFQNLRTTKLSFIDTINTSNLRTKTVDNALVRMTDIAAEMRVELINQTEGLYDNTIPNIRTFADNAITRFTNLINTRVDGRYVFAGHDVATEPFLDPATVKTAYNGAITASPPITSATIQAETTAFFNGTTPAAGFTEGNYMNNDYTNNGNTTIRVDEGVDLQYGELANDSAFADVLEVLYAFQNINYQAGDDAEYYDLVHNWALPQIESAFDAINEMVGKNGVVMTQLSDLNEEHKDFLTLAETQIIDIEEADQFESITRLQTLQSQLEASYRTTATIRQTSLVNFL